MSEDHEITKSLWPEDDVATCKRPVDLSSRVWRSGNLLVMDRRAQLPDICLLTGRPASHRVERELNYYPVGCHLLLLLGIFPYLILTMLLTSTVRIEFGLCERCYLRQKQRLLYGKIFGCFGAATIVAAIAFGLIMSASELSVVLIFFGALIGLAGLAMGFAGSCLVVAYKIDADYIWLLGVDRDLLTTLPEWPRT